MYQIELEKLAFMHRILKRPHACVYREIFLKRFFYILYNDTVARFGPIAQILRVCQKYNLLEVVRNMILSAQIPTKASWTKFCRNALMDHEFTRWRMQLKMYRKLSDFRVVYTTIDISIWSIIPRYNVHLKHACSTMLRLTVGCSQLRINTDIHLPMEERICPMCKLAHVEDLFHLVMECEHYDDIRKLMFEKISMGISYENWDHLQSLPTRIVYYILLGKCYPISMYNL